MCAIIICLNVLHPHIQYKELCDSSDKEDSCLQIPLCAVINLQYKLIMFSVLLLLLWSFH